MTERYADRRSAGIALAKRLARYRGREAVILGLPRGGLPVAAELAEALDLPLDIVLVRKIGVPGNPELALAAVAGPEGRTLALNRELATAFGLDARGIEDLAVPQRAELARRRQLWLGASAGAGLAGKIAILVDDGMATGATMRAAIAAVREQAPAQVVVAVPVAASDAVAALRGIVDQVVCLSRPEPFIAVGAHYARFPQVSDAEVRDILDAAASRVRRAGRARRDRN